MDTDKTLDRLAAMRRDADQLILILIGMEAILSFARAGGLDLTNDPSWTKRVLDLREVGFRLHQRVRDTEF